MAKNNELVTVFFYSESREALLQELETHSIRHSRPQKSTQAALGAGIDADTVKLGLEFFVLSANSVVLLFDIIKKFKNSSDGTKIIYRAPLFI
ncbi:MAG: hypothetical protein AAGA83_23680 [Cyanobacteria bacterium P01_F01_bin.116]